MPKEIKLLQLSKKMNSIRLLKSTNLSLTAVPFKRTFVSRTNPVRMGGGHDDEHHDHPVSLLFILFHSIKS